MFRASDIIGKPIVDYNTGTVLNRIDDVVYDSSNHMLLGFSVDESWMLSRGRMVPFSMVRSIGPDAVMVDDEAAIVTDDQEPEIASIRKQTPQLKGHRVLTEDGQNLGSVADFFFNSHTGEIEGYEVSSGPMNDVYAGPSFLPVDHIAKIGDDVVLVVNDTIELFRDQVGGLKATTQETLTSAKEKFEDIKEGTRQKAAYSMEFMDSKVEDIKSGSQTGLKEVGSRAEDAKSTVGNLWEEIKEKATDFRERGAEQVEEQRIKGALGRPVTRVILDEDDNIILNTGDLITHEAVNLARQSGILDVLLNSVYTGTPQFDKEEMKAPEEKEE